jgi:uncharacterized membrane protein
MHIRNPVEWSLDQLKSAGSTIEFLITGDHVKEDGQVKEELRAPPAIRAIDVGDIRDALVKGLDDFAAFRDDVVLICVVYPIVGLVLARLAFGYEMLPLLFPMASGFALIGPFAAVLLYEMSRRREQGLEVTWADGFAVVRSRAFGTIMALGFTLMALFLIWLGAAWAIYALTLGPEPPTSIVGFARDVLTTDRGRALIVIGVGVGFLFAVLSLSISVVSFPLLIDRQVRLSTAVRTSLKAVMANPAGMALWGLVVAAGLAIGTVPLFLGLIVVVPVLGHATWHLYRKVVVFPGDDQDRADRPSYRNRAAPRDGGGDHATFFLAPGQWPRVFPGL